MSQTNITPTAEKRSDVPAVPPAKWWGRYMLEGNPPRARFVVRWGRILTALSVFCVAGYLALMSALWGYFTFYKKIPDIAWIDVVVLPRYGRVQTAMGNYYFSEARKLWESRNYAQAVMTARAAVLKAPANLEARLFLADSWVLFRRKDEAIRVLKEGIRFHPSDKSLQKRLLETCQSAGKPLEVLKVLREDLPALGIHLLDGNDRSFQIAEVQAVLETAGALEAEALAARRNGFANDPVAAPMMARIEWELDRKQVAFEHLAAARDRAPDNPAIHEAYVESAIRVGKPDEARAAATRFLGTFPDLVAARLKFLEAYGSRKGGDERPWTAECMRFLTAYQRAPEALMQLGSLAASQGWSDVTYLLYQNSLEENLNGFPFAAYYVASLVKTGNYAAAEFAWRDLAVKNSAQLTVAPHLEALVMYGAGRESEAMQVVDRLRRETEGNGYRRKMLERIFKTFSFPKLAEQLVAPQKSAALAD